MANFTIPSQWSYHRDSTAQTGTPNTNSCDASWAAVMIFAEWRDAAPLLRKSGAARD
jgi:hypothetical protein